MKWKTVLATALGVAAGVVGLRVLARESEERDTLTRKEVLQLSKGMNITGLTAEDLTHIAQWESDFNRYRRKGSHRGLWQLAPSSVSDFNERYGTNRIPQDLYDPERSLPIVEDHFRRIVASYKAVGLTPSHPDWFGLVYAGHNAGYSRVSGVAFVYQQLRDAGTELTLENLPKAAAAVGASPHLYNPDKVAYWQRVVDSR